VRRPEGNLIIILKLLLVIEGRTWIQDRGRHQIGRSGAIRIGRHGVAQVDSNVSWHRLGGHVHDFISQELPGHTVGIQHSQQFDEDLARDIIRMDLQRGGGAKPKRVGHGIAEVWSPGVTYWGKRYYR